MIDESSDAFSVAVIEEESFARLYGQPLKKLPDDLYIPPDALEVFLETFEGPLDLLLYLIRRQNFNVLDIPMESLTRQYLSYIDQIREKQIELAAEYLLMAAMLIEIKSRMLLPVSKTDTDGESVEDPRAQLVRRLLEYEQIKEGAILLEKIPREGRDFWVPQAVMEMPYEVVHPKVEAIDLKLVLMGIMQRAQWVAHHKISREELSVREFMSRILKQLRECVYIEFEQLGITDTTQITRQQRVVFFMAMLELARESLIEITQAVPFAPVYVQSRSA